MKLKAIIILAAIALIVTSCGIGGGGANDVITYNNAMVDYLNEAGDNINDAAEELQVMNDMVTNKRKVNFNGMGAFFGPQPDVNSETDGVLLLEGTGLPSEVKDDVANSIKATSDAFNKAAEAYKGFADYYKSEDFKDDDWAKGGEYVETLTNNITAFYENRAVLFELIEPHTEAAEEEMLADHPLKESFIAIKKDLKLAGKVADNVYSEEVDMDALNKHYDELEANHAKHKDLTPDLLTEHNKKIYYDMFYKSVEEMIGEIRKSKRDGDISDRDTDNIVSDYESLIDAYNRMTE